MKRLDLSRSGMLITESIRLDVSLEDDDDARIIVEKEFYTIPP